MAASRRRSQYRGEMGVAHDLGYQFRPPNALQRALQAFGSSTVGAWTFSKILAPTDRVVHRLSKGRTSTPAILAGLPVLMVTTTGRRSGAPRTTPLIAVPIGDSLALLGTNFGQKKTPAWVYNLEADPHCRVSYRSATCELVVRPATEAEAAQVWEASKGIYGGYEKYLERIDGRTVRLFILLPSH